MPPVRFTAIRMCYGKHERSIELPMISGPLVIDGPNGSGKTTLLECLMRAIFGFHRRGDEGDHSSARRPWSGGACDATVRFVDKAGTEIELRRCFDDDDVTVTTVADGKVIFDGEANPGGRNQTIDQFNALMMERVGIRDSATYERTLFIAQGQLARPEIAAELLQLAVGGAGSIDGAKATIEKQLDKLTRTGVDGAGRARKDRELETIDARLADLLAIARDSERAEQARVPLQNELDKSIVERDALAERIGGLVQAQAPVATRQAALERCHQYDERLVKLKGEIIALDALASEYTRASEDHSRMRGRAVYPPDFRERCATLKVLWAELERERRAAESATKDREQLRAPSAVMATAAVVTGILGAVGLGMSQRAIGAALLVTTAVLLAVWLMHRREHAVRIAELDRVGTAADKRIAEVTTNIAAKVAGVPESGTLTAATVPHALAAFDEQLRVASVFSTAERRLADHVSHLRARLVEVKATRTNPAPGKLPEATELLAALRAAESETQQSLAAERYALAQTVLGELPGGVKHDAGSIGGALEEARRSEVALHRRIAGLQQRLLEEGAAPESSLAVREKIAGLGERRAQVQQRIAVLRGAATLLTDAYSRFRDRDQARLLGHISARSEALSGGTLGPFASDGALEETTIEAYGEPRPIACPPLSFGELHCAGLAIRLGSADFLTGIGIVLPLLVDDPFAHLDAAHAEAVWRLLGTIAEERQVIITTHETEFLERLGVEAHVHLS